ncbi:MAG: hypothetical protein IKK26_06825 [Clostridia bacterium]|nr:hypothetical protein [Clostridia bacterium]
MKETKRLIKRGLLAGLATQLIIVMLLSTVVYAKYIRTETFTGTIQITVDLGNIALLESKANKELTGQYVLDKNDILDGTTDKEGNTYTHVLPGLDIPKDPYITVTGKTTIPAYIYVEIKADDIFKESSDHTPDYLTYELTNDWLSLGMKGRNGGDLYVYSGGAGAAKAVTADIAKISILVGDKITVSQELNLSTITPVSMKIYAAMAEVVSGKTAAEIYTANGAA